MAQVKSNNFTVAEFYNLNGFDRQFGQSRSLIEQRILRFSLEWNSLEAIDKPKEELTYDVKEPLSIS